MFCGGTLRISQRVWWRSKSVTESQRMSNDVRCDDIYPCHASSDVISQLQFTQIQSLTSGKRRRGIILVFRYSLAAAWEDMTPVMLSQHHYEALVRIRDWLSGGSRIPHLYEVMLKECAYKWLVIVHLSTPSQPMCNQSLTEFHCHLRN